MTLERDMVSLTFQCIRCGGELWVDLSEEPAHQIRCQDCRTLQTLPDPLDLALTDGDPSRITVMTAVA